MRKYEQNIERGPKMRDILAIILESLAMIIWELRIRKSLLLSDYDNEIYQAMKNHHMFQLVFLGPNGKETYKFLSFLLLESQLQMHEYLFMHGELLVFLQRYPSKDFVHFYHTCIINWGKSNNPHSKLVIITYLQHFQQKLNPYCCILLSASLRWSGDLEESLL